MAKISSFEEVHLQEAMVSMHVEGVKPWNAPEQSLEDWIVTPFDVMPWQDCESYKHLRHALRVLPCSFAFTTFIAGGLLVRALAGIDEVNDVDLFCQHGLQREAIIAKLDPTKKHELVKSKYFNAMLLKLPGMALQLCQCNYGTWPSLVLQSFPTYHCMIATDGKEVIYHKNTLNNILDRKLVSVEGYPRAHSGWYEKYVKMGFEPDENIAKWIANKVDGYPVEFQRNGFSSDQMVVTPIDAPIVITPNGTT